MGSTCDGANSAKKGDFHLPSHSINKYLPQGSKVPSSSKEKLSHIVRTISPSHESDQLFNLALYIDKQSGKSFKDKNFPVLEAEEKNYTKSFLHIMFNYERMTMKELYKPEPTDCGQIKQNQVQFCYLTSVFYLLCVHVQLKKHIILTQRINLYNCYLFRLYCFGQQTIVVVDDSLPMEGQTTKYLNIGKKKEIWPVMLEKAWCKQVRGYLSAKGLSPQDAFEEITGFPAYSYSLITQSKSSTMAILEEAMQSKYWIVLTANINGEKEFKSRQVFYLDTMKGKDLYLRTPYSRVEYESEEEKGLIKLGVEQVLEYFEFITIGFYIPRYKLHSFPLKLPSQRDHFFEVTVQEKEEFNIRFIQLFSEYLEGINVENYDYSSLIFELYNSKYQIVEGCEGCVRAGEGSRSANITQMLMVALEPGKYYLRIEVNWVKESVLNEGRLVAYCTEGNFKLQQLKESDVFDLLPKIIIKAFNNQNSRIILKNNVQDLKVKMTEKKYKYLIGIENISDKEADIKILFTQSENIRVKLQNFERENGVVSVKLKIPPENEQILQIVAANPRYSMVLNPFEIQRH